MRTVLYIFVALTLTAAVGCEPDHHHHGDEHAKVCEASMTSDEYAGAEIVEQPGAKIGDLTRCPISGAVFKVTEASPASVQKGDTYYTCCGGCVDQLEKSFARRR